MLLLIKEAHQRKISQLNAYGGEKTQLIVAMFLSAYVIAIMAMDQLALFNPKDGTFLYAILSVFILAGSIFGGLMIYITVAIKRNRQLIYEQNYQNLALYLTELETSYNKLRHFKHDYKNSLLTLKIYQQQSDPLKVFDALDQLIDIEGKQTNELPTIHELDHIQSIPIKGIIYTKVLKARKKNIRTSLRIEPIQDITEFEWSVNEILGILLDNAIQASELVDNPWIEIVAYEHLGVVEFVILNCVDDSTQSIDWMMTSGHTTKNSGQGIGLNSLQEQVSEHDNMFFSMQRENNCVKAILTIEV
jgi:two-component system sensor histidine kinase AgrC